MARDFAQKSLKNHECGCLFIIFPLSRCPSTNSPLILKIFHQITWSLHLLPIPSLPLQFKVLHPFKAFYPAFEREYLEGLPTRLASAWSENMFTHWFLQFVAKGVLLNVYSHANNLWGW